MIVGISELSAPTRSSARSKIICDIGLFSLRAERLNFRSRSWMVTVNLPGPSLTSFKLMEARRSLVRLGGPPAQTWLRPLYELSGGGEAICIARQYLPSSTPERPSHSMSDSQAVLRARRVSTFIEYAKPPASTE